MRKQISRRNSRSGGRAPGDWETFNATVVPQNIPGGIAYTAAPPTWSQNVNIPINSYSTFQIAAQSPLPQGGVGISVGSAELSDVELKVVFLGTANAAPVLGFYDIGIGLYMSQFDRTNVVWTTRAPLGVNDITRDDWLQLKYDTCILPAAATIAASTVPFWYRGLALSFKHKRPIRFGQGECPAITIGATGPAGAGTVTTAVYCRVRYSKVW